MARPPRPRNRYGVNGPTPRSLPSEPQSEPPKSSSQMLAARPLVRGHPAPRADPEPYFSTVRTGSAGRSCAGWGPAHQQRSADGRDLWGSRHRSVTHHENVPYIQRWRLVMTVAALTTLTEEE